jgi:hypothetical protein
MAALRADAGSGYAASASAARQITAMSGAANGFDRSLSSLKPPVDSALSMGGGSADQLIGAPSALDARKAMPSSMLAKDLFDAPVER